MTWATVAVTVLVAAGCGGASDDGGGGAASGGSEQVNFFTPTDIIGWGVYLADAKHYFQDSGLNVKVTTFASGSDAADAFKTQGGTWLQAGDLPSVRFVSKPGTTAIAQITSWTGLRFVASDDIQSPQDLAGKKVAVNQGSSTEFWLDRYIEENGLQDQVKVIYLDPASQAPALLRGDIDAAAMFLPQAVTVLQENKGFHLVESWPSALIMVADDNFLEQHRDDVIKALQVLDKSGKEIASDPQGSMEAVSGAHGLTDAQFEQALDNAKLDFEPKFDKKSYELTQDMIKWLQDQQQVPADFDFCAHYDLSVLTEALPDADVYNPCKK